ncbi:alpha-amylase family glycosyl hydrolase [Dictyobacter formicarum]
MINYIKDIGFTAIWITPVVMLHDAHAPYPGYRQLSFYPNL